MGEMNKSIKNLAIYAAILGSLLTSFDALDPESDKHSPR
jgi:hypothetical protein